MTTSQPKKRRVIERKYKSPDGDKGEIATTNFDHPLMEAVTLENDGPPSHFTQPPPEEIRMDQQPSRPDSDEEEIAMNLDHPRTLDTRSTAVLCDIRPPHFKLFISKSVQCNEPPPYLKLVTSRGVQCEMPVEPPHDLEVVTVSRGVQCLEGELTAAASELDEIMVRPNIEHLLQLEVPVPVPVPAATPTKSRLRRKVKQLQQRLKRRTSRIRNMKDVIHSLQKECGATESLIETLENNFSGLPLNLFRNKVANNGKNKRRAEYIEQIKEFALTLYFYSPKGYNYMKTLNFGLPHPRTLRKWLSQFHCVPGFLEEVFLYLKKNVNEKQYLKHVNLVFDGMSIRKQVIFDAQKGKNVGYVDMGGLLTASEEALATEALVFQIVSIKGNFKCVVGYFFINKLGAVELSQLIKTAIVKLHEVGVKVANVTCDGTSTNISAFKLLGCKLPDKTFFTLEGLDYNVTVMLDPAHMIKLCRNTLADKKEIETEKGTVYFKYIQRLNDLQQKEGLTFKNKLSEKHIHYHNRKMNVQLAAQTISGSVADALEYLWLVRRHPSFEGCMPTVEFLRKMDALFDYLNSRNPLGKGSKSPITLEKKKSVMISCCVRFFTICHS